MSVPEITSPAPDWLSPSTLELCCPLCGYNLRGLTDPRCPECGFAFTWEELIRGVREKHPYLFEHHPERNVWSFWKTYVSDSQVRQFWSKLSPAQAVNIPRVLIYWFVANLTIAVPFAYVFGMFSLRLFQRRWPSFIPLGGFPTSYYRTLGGPATTPDKLQFAWFQSLEFLSRSSLVPAAATLMVWPWLTLAFLMIFSQSMRQAKIKKRHVLRAVVYGTDFGFLMLFLLWLDISEDYRSAWPCMIILICVVLSLYRVGFAYSSYLRFHMPFATVFASQVLVTLVMLIVWLRITYA